MIWPSDRQRRVKGPAFDPRGRVKASWTKRSRPASAAHDRVGKTERDGSDERIPAQDRGLKPGATSEQKLVRSARAGDQDAFAELVVMHAGHVVGALRRFGLDASDADEVAQEVFLRAWRGLARFEERAQFSTWVYRIAFNEAQRRLSRRAPPRVEVDPDRDDAVTSLPEAAHLGPEAQALDHEFQQALDRALVQLPHEWRAAVVLRDIEGLSTQEAARVVGARQLAFKSRLHRGRMQLRALLEPYLELEEG
jgi:RNA polymerase sigma-70 factor, ECF subfamily